MYHKIISRKEKAHKARSLVRCCLWSKETGWCLRGKHYEEEDQELSTTTISTSISEGETEVWRDQHQTMFRKMKSTADLSAQGKSILRSIRKDIKTSMKHRRNSYEIYGFTAREVGSEEGETEKEKQMSNLNTDLEMATLKTTDQEMGETKNQEIRKRTHDPVVQPIDDPVIQPIYHPVVPPVDDHAAHPIETSDTSNSPGAENRGIQCGISVSFMEDTPPQASKLLLAPTTANGDPPKPLAIFSEESTSVRVILEDSPSESPSVLRYGELYNTSGPMKELNYNLENLQLLPERGKSVDLDETAWYEICDRTETVFIGMSSGKTAAKTDPQMKELNYNLENLQLLPERGKSVDLDETAWYEICDRTETIFIGMSSGKTAAKIDPQKISVEEAEFLSDLQDRLLEKTTIETRFALLAWILFVVWLVACCTAIIIFAINFDITNKYQVTNDILEAANSSCPATEFANTTIYVDVNGTDAMNLALSVSLAVEENEAFEPYPTEGSVFSEDVPESWRFILGSVWSWFLGVFLMSFLVAPVNGILNTIKGWDYHERVRRISAEYLENVGKIHVDEIPQSDAIFLLIFIPATLLRLRDSPVLHSQRKRRRCKCC